MQGPDILQDLPQERQDIFPFLLPAPACLPVQEIRRFLRLKHKAVPV